MQVCTTNNIYKTMRIKKRNGISSYVTTCCSAGVGWIGLVFSGVLYVCEGLNKLMKRTAEGRCWWCVFLDKEHHLLQTFVILCDFFS